MTRSSDHELLASGSYDEQREVGGSSTSAAVDAYGEALSDLLERFLSDAREALAR
jgi:ABC-type uncharacterized transport system auxiliary subunit